MRRVWWILALLASPLVVFVDDDLLERWLSRATLKPQDPP